MQQLNRQTRRTSLGFLVWFALLAACSPDRADPGEALEKMATRFEGSLGAPAAAGFAASAESSGSGRSLAEIETARLERLQIYNQLETVAPASLDADSERRFYALRDRLAPLVELDRYAMGGDEAPGPYLLTDRHGAFVLRINALSVRPVTDRASADAWLASLADAAHAIETETQRFRVETSAGIIPPASILQRAISDLDLQLDPTREPLVLTHFRNELKQQTDIAQFETNRMADEARSIYASDVAPALDKLRTIFSELLPNAPSAPGLGAQPDGEQRYRALLAFYTTPGIAPDELATLAATAMEDARLEADALLAELELTDAPVGQRLIELAATAHDEGAQPPPETTDVTPANPDAAIAARMSQRFDWARNNLAQIISTGAIRPLTVTAERLHPHAPRWPVRGSAQLDPAAADRLLFDASEFVHWPDWSLPVLVYAEGLPGRHLIASQRSFAHPVRNGAGAGLADGWALYAAGVASDLGGYDDRPEDRIGYVQYTILQAGLAAADIGIHSQSWSREQAVEQLTSATGLPNEAIDSFVDEIIRRPGKSAAAFAGTEAIWNFRERADRRLGPTFDLRRFHDIIITGGPRPLTTVERDVEAWIISLEAPAPLN